MIINTGNGGSANSASSFTFEKDGTKIVAHHDSAYWYWDNTMHFRILLISGLFDSKSSLMVSCGDTINSIDFTSMNLSATTNSSIDYYTADTIYPGLPEYSQIYASFTITSCDTVDSLVSGTFSGDLLNNFTNDTVRIRNGNFTSVKFRQFIP